VKLTPLYYQEIADGQLPHIARPRAMDKKREDGRGGAAGPSHVPWTPLFRMQLNCLEGVGELSLCRLVEALGNTEVPDLASQIICATEEGEVCTHSACMIAHLMTLTRLSAPDCDGRLAGARPCSSC
jgi:hypothetical protein